jgi:aldehyde dehydrogenase (NAD+)
LHSILLRNLGRERGIKAIDDYLKTKSVLIFTASAAPANSFLQR